MNRISGLIALAGFVETHVPVKGRRRRIGNRRIRGVPQAARWQRALVGSPPSAFEADLNAVDMAGGVLVAAYVANEPKAGRLMGVDARTGNPLWDVAIPNTDRVSDADEMTVTATRVYLPHWTWLDVFDARTGAHLATLGAW